jgi:hypothetical protein
MLYINLRYHKDHDSASKQSHSYLVDGELCLLPVPRPSSGSRPSSAKRYWIWNRSRHCAVRHARFG